MLLLLLQFNDIGDGNFLKANAERHTPDREPVDGVDSYFIWEGQYQSST